MNVGILLVTAAAGGLGAALRYAIDQMLTSVRRPGFSVGILLVNVTGSLGLGIVTGVGASLAPGLAVALGVGLLGGYTTFSTVHVETVLLAQQGRWRPALRNVCGTAILSIAAATAGIALGIWAGT